MLGRCAPVKFAPFMSYIFGNEVRLVPPGVSPHPSLTTLRLFCLFFTHVSAPLVSCLSYVLGTWYLCTVCLLKCEAKRVIRDLVLRKSNAELEDQKCAHLFFVLIEMMVEGVVEASGDLKHFVLSLQ